MFNLDQMLNLFIMLCLTFYFRFSCHLFICSFIQRIVISFLIASVVIWKTDSLSLILLVFTLRFSKAESHASLPLSPIRKYIYFSLAFNLHKNDLPFLLRAISSDIYIFLIKWLFWALYFKLFLVSWCSSSNVWILGP